MTAATGATAALESVLRRERAAVVTGLAGAVAIAWVWLVPASLDMYGEMNGPAAWMMAASWDGRYFSLMFGMWSLMMLGMMLPSATPAILLFGAVLRSRPQAEASVARQYIFTLGYLLAWTGFSLAATLLQWALSHAGLLSPMMESTSAVAGGVLLLAAGLYQWTPLKQSCLARCRSPMDWLSRHWQPQLSGALRMGLEHGLYCVGCCWMLMLLLFVGGVMSLTWIAGITIFVLLEKLAPFGVQGGRLSGLLLIAAGATVLLLV